MQYFSVLGHSSKTFFDVALELPFREFGVAFTSKLAFFYLE
jgi:hypothetical protein